MDQPIPILARGREWVVVAKPPRIICHRNKQARKARAMLQRVRDQLGKRVYLVHRLDRNTSGCPIFPSVVAMATRISIEAEFRFADKSSKHLRAFL